MTDMISFIIPTLNEEKVLGKLLKNLREIKTLEYEVIVSDGGSTDKTVSIAKTLADKVIEHTKPGRQTIGEGRNDGARVSSGEFLVFLDADVHIFKPDEFFARALKHFLDNPKLVGLGGWLRVFPEMETFGDRIGYNIFSNWTFSLHNNILKTGGNCGEFGVIRKAAFFQIGGYRENLVAGEDFDLFHRLAQVGKVLTDPKLLVYHTGRRPHKIGWMKLLWIWNKNYFYLLFLNRSAEKEWSVIR